MRTRAPSSCGSQGHSRGRASSHAAIPEASGVVVLCDLIVPSLLRGMRDCPQTALTSLPHGILSPMVLSTHGKYHSLEPLSVSLLRTVPAEAPQNPFLLQPQLDAMRRNSPGYPPLLEEAGLSFSPAHTSSVLLRMRPLDRVTLSPSSPSAQFLRHRWTLPCFLSVTEQEGLPSLKSLGEKLSSCILGPHCALIKKMLESWERGKHGGTSCLSYGFYCEETPWPRELLKRKSMN